MLRTAIASFAVLFWSSMAMADQWAEKMFETRSHDFGAVARAAKVEFPFKVNNLYDQEVHIVAVRSSCGCTQPRIGKATIKPHDQGEIIAAFNTNAFTGQRGARVTVTIDRPRYAEIELDVRGYIRTDVVVNPSQVALGSVPRGLGAEKKIHIEYAGRNDWKITGLSAQSPYIEADFKETARAAGRVSYELDVRLKDDAPTGYVNEQIVMTTNDRRATHFPVKVEGLVVANLTVSPAALMFGTLQPGERVAKQIVVKGSKPFKIVEIRCADGSLTFQHSDEAKAVHLVPLQYEAASTTGKISHSVEIITDLDENNTALLSVSGQIAAPLAGN